MSYHDNEGNEISLYKLVRQEPDWAVSIIPHLKRKLKAKAEDLKAAKHIISKQNSELDAKNKALKDSVPKSELQLIVDDFYTNDSMCLAGVLTRVKHLLLEDKQQ